MDSPLLKPAEAARQLGITEDALIRHVRDGELDYVNIGRGTLKIRRRFKQEDIDAFIKRRSRTDKPPGPDKPAGTPRDAAEGVFDIKQARSLRKARKLGDRPGAR